MPKVVSISNNNGRVKLRWGYQGKRYNFNPGYDYDQTGIKIAQIVAHQIELDIESGNFDPTLEKYRQARNQKAEELSSVTLLELFERFMGYKATFCDPRTLEKYQACSNHVQDFLGNHPANFISEKNALDFAQFLKNKVSPTTAKGHLTLIKAAFDYGIEHKLIIAQSNPWAETVSNFKVPVRPRPKPFTLEEVQQIIEAFQGHCYYSYYYPYVSFLFRTGVRTGEAIGLKWKYIADDLSSAWIGESVSKGVRKTTKNNRSRTIPLSDHLIPILKEIKPKGVSQDEFVFQAARGGPVKEKGFRERAWKPILSDLKIEYRKPYCTRHTFISHALASGMNPMEVAQLTGHDIRTLYEDYAGFVVKTPRIFEF